MKRLLKSSDGSALTFVILAMVILIIMSAIIATIAQTNLTQASTQEQGLQAYYAARSGAELAFSALWVEKSGTTTTLFTELKTSTPAPESVDFGSAGSANVSIAYAKSGTTETVTIRSVGNYKNVKKPITLKVYFEYDSATGKSNYTDMVWSK